jgi:acetyltransferase-like isoleucine patch superfamily enzyme
VTAGDTEKRGKSAGELVSRVPGALRSRFDRQIYELGYGWGPRLMSALRKRWILLMHRHATVVFQGPVYIGPGFSLNIPGPGTFIVGPNTEFRRGFRAEIAGGGQIVIGARCVFSYYSLIQCTGYIEVGDGSGIGQSCAIFDGNHKFRDLDEPFTSQGFEIYPVRIGKECGILTKTTIINDVGDRSQIGANSVVVKPIPAYCVAVGSPAKVVDYFGPEDERPAELSEGNRADAADDAAGGEHGAAE